MNCRSLPPFISYNLNEKESKEWNAVICSIRVSYFVWFNLILAMIPQTMQLLPIRNVEKHNKKDDTTLRTRTTYVKILHVIHSNRSRWFVHWVHPPSIRRETKHIENYFSFSFHSLCSMRTTSFSTETIFAHNAHKQTLTQPIWHAWLHLLVFAVVRECVCARCPLFVRM